MTAFGDIPAHTVQTLKGRTRAGLEAAARAAGDHMVAIDLTGCAGKDEVLAAIARGFGFADWFGNNLDALYDSLTDLAADGAGGYVVLLEHLPRAPRLGAPARAALLDVFRDAARFHARAGMPFRVFYA